MKNLKILRKNIGLTQREMSEKLNIPKTNLGYYELGITEPSIETMIKMADFFGCSVDYLIGHETPGIMHLDSLTKIQQGLVSSIKELDEADCYRVEAYVEGIKSTRQEQERLRKKFQNSNID